MSIVKIFRKKKMGKEKPPKPIILKPVPYDSSVVKIKEEPLVEFYETSEYSNEDKRSKKNFKNISELIIRNVSSDKETVTEFLDTIKIENIYSFLRFFFKYKTNNAFAFFICFIHNGNLSVYDLHCSNNKNNNTYRIKHYTYRMDNFDRVQFEKNSLGYGLTLMGDRYDLYIPETNIKNYRKIFFNVRKLF